jgi:hypothetical protein
MISLGEEVKPSAPYRKILGHLKITWKYEQKYFARQILIPFAHSSWLLPHYSAIRTARQLWWTSEEFPFRHHHSTMFVHARISPRGWTIGPLATAVQWRSLSLLTCSSSYPVTMTSEFVLCYTLILFISKLSSCWGSNRRYGLRL